MRRAIYPGSFDPVTNGHLDVIERARKLFDEVIVAVAHNDQKQPLFSLEQRLDFLRTVTDGMDGVKIAPLDGLLVDFAVQQEARAVVRGLRAVSDFEFEFQMALMNRKLEGERGNDLPHAEGGIHLSQLADREGNRAARRRRQRIRAIVCGGKFSRKSQDNEAGRLRE